MERETKWTKCMRLRRESHEPQAFKIAIIIIIMMITNNNDHHHDDNNNLD